MEWCVHKPKKPAHTIGERHGFSLECPEGINLADLPSALWENACRLSHPVCKCSVNSSPSYLNMLMDLHLQGPIGSSSQLQVIFHKCWGQHHDSSSSHCFCIPVSGQRKEREGFALSLQEHFPGLAHAISACPELHLMPTPSSNSGSLEIQSSLWLSMC